MGVYYVNVHGSGILDSATVLAPSESVARSHALAAVRRRRGLASSVQLFAETIPVG